MDYYDSIAYGYEELHREEQQNKIRLLMPFLKISQKTMILDVGCGTGIFFESERLNDADFGLPKENRTGIDPSAGLIAIARKKKNGRYLVASAEDIPFEDGAFDIVVSITAIQNFADVKKGLSEMKRVGKKNAAFILTFLKKSQKKKMIEDLICQMFDVTNRIDEGKDMIFICK